MRVLYIDQVWVVNFCMDAAILVAAAWMARRKVRRRRIVLGSALGASYALLLFVPGAMAPALSGGAKLAFSCLMVLVTFRPRHWVEFLRYFGFFYLASFVTGGAVYALASLFADASPLGGMVIVSGHAFWRLNPGFFLALAVPVVYLLGKTAWNRMERLKHREGNLWRVRISIDDKQIELTGLLDTGNALTDPLSGLPVAVVEWSALEPLLPASVAEAYRENRDAALSLGNQEIGSDWQSRFRIVPYRGVGGTTGMLLAFRPSGFTVSQGDVQAQTSRILIAINPKPLAGDRSYQAILPPSCVTETNDSIAS